MEKKILGGITTVDIPALGLHGLSARVDTGARTSALQAAVREVVEVNGIKVLRYSAMGSEVLHETSAFRRVFIRSSNGLREARYIVPLELVIDGTPVTAEVGLTDRSSMRHPFLVGRTALAGNFLVDVADFD